MHPGIAKALSSRGSNSCSGAVIIAGVGRAGIEVGIVLQEEGEKSVILMQERISWLTYHARITVAAIVEAIRIHRVCLHLDLGAIATWTTSQTALILEEMR